MLSAALFCVLSAAAYAAPVAPTEAKPIRALNTKGGPELARTLPIVKATSLLKRQVQLPEVDGDTLGGVEPLQDFYKAVHSGELTDDVTSQVGDDLDHNKKRQTLNLPVVSGNAFEPFKHIGDADAQLTEATERIPTDKLDNKLDEVPMDKVAQKLPPLKARKDSSANQGVTGPLSSLSQGLSLLGKRSVPLEDSLVDELPTNELPTENLPTDELPTDILPTDTLPTDSLPVDSITGELSSLKERTDTSTAEGVTAPLSSLSKGLSLLGKRGVPVGSIAVLAEAALHGVEGIGQTGKRAASLPDPSINGIPVPLNELPVDSLLAGVGKRGLGGLGGVADLNSVKEDLDLSDYSEDVPLDGLEALSSSGL